MTTGEPTSESANALRSEPRRWRSSVAGVAVVVMLAVLTSCSSGSSKHAGDTSSTPSTPEPVVGASSDAKKPPVPGAGKLYVGAYVGPTDRSDAAKSPANLAHNVAEFEQQLGHPLTVTARYYNFNDPAVSAAMSSDGQAGRIPMVNLRCAGPAADILDHKLDSLIDATADRFAAYGKPVFLRYFWEMNLSGRTGAHDTCLGSASNEADRGTLYVKAWRYVHAIFQAHGATNVAWVWCPSHNQGKSSDPYSTHYYPGDDVVDWIAADGYTKNLKGKPPLVDHFKDFFGHWASNGKPEMIGETGAPQPAQAAWLQDAHRDVPAELPDLRAIMYFDAPGESPSLIKAGQTYVLSGSGLSAFVSIANDQSFAYRPST